MSAVQGGSFVTSRSSPVVDRSSSTPRCLLMLDVPSFGPGSSPVVRCLSSTWRSLQGLCRSFLENAGHPHDHEDDDRLDRSAPICADYGFADFRKPGHRNCFIVLSPGLGRLSGTAQDMATLHRFLQPREKDFPLFYATYRSYAKPT